jgi:hypothetical protein
MHGRISPEPHVSSWSSESRESPAAGENDSLSQIERRILDAGKAEHWQTTDSARRALQVWHLEDAGRAAPIPLTPLLSRSHTPLTLFFPSSFQVAEQTVEIGSYTLIEVHRQGQQLDGLNRNFDTVRFVTK